MFYIDIICRYMFGPCWPSSGRNTQLLFSYFRKLPQLQWIRWFLLGLIYCICCCCLFNMRLWVVQMIIDHFNIKCWNLKVVKCSFFFLK
jgi:hypothetical protein